MAETHLAVNVDVDSLALYYRIHGLDPSRATDAAWDVGIPRFLELFESLGLKATFFVVASDLERPGPRSVASDAARLGHELASHTFSHPYNLIHLPLRRVEDELARAEDLIGAVSGEPVVGFRAPGYNITRSILLQLADRGYLYDSSLFPCPAYYAVRTAVIAGMRLRGRRSGSIVGRPLHSLTPRGPHRRAGLVEFPMTVLPGIRFPLIGTSLTLLGRVGVGALRPALSAMGFVNLELHAVDLLDHRDVPEDLVRHQPDLKTSFEDKAAIFRKFLEMAARGRTNGTLAGLVGRYCEPRGS